MITELKGVGPATAKRFTKLGIHNIQDLLFYLPLRYQDRTKITAIKNVQIGEYAVIEGEIINSTIVRSNLLIQISDGAHQLTVRLFHFNAAQYKTLKNIGAKIRCYGETRWGQYGIEMIHPEYRLLTKNMPLEERLTPVYPTTAGLSQYTLRKITTEALKMLQEKPLKEYLPQEILTKYNFPDINTAIQCLHRPLTEAIHEPAKKRLIFSELLAQQLSMQRLRQQVRNYNSTALTSNNLFTKFIKNLPFKLTTAQLRVIKEISADLKQKKPMLRLLQGDVGSGKTVVALADILQAIENGYQAAIMAPTELLATQHYQNFINYLKGFKINIAFLSGTLSSKIKKEIMGKIADGTTQIIIGTHALFQKEVKFNNLALCVIDEQHRFGVHQRLSLCAKGQMPHQLIMTATPIPRTLAMLAYADLDCSIIDTLPPGRKPVTTTVIANSKRLEVLQRVRTCCQKGQQAYWVCPLIAESEVLQCEAAEKTAQTLGKNLSELTIGLIHGRLPPIEKQQIMRDFKDGKINLLVATTVIEVGVDVKNANLMIIENPERLGLAQLHQLRGRVGRGNQESHCVLLYQQPLSEQTKQRLLSLRNSNNGFELAKKDLELRGPGELLGTRQTGLLKFRIADIIRDQDMLPEIQKTAQLLLSSHPDNITKIINRWVGNKDQYALV